MENLESDINLNLNPVDLCRGTNPDTEGGVGEKAVGSAPEKCIKIQNFTTQLPGFQTEEELLSFEERIRKCVVFLKQPESWRKRESL